MGPTPIDTSPPRTRRRAHVSSTAAPELAAAAAAATTTRTTATNGTSGAAAANVRARGAAWQAGDGTPAHGRCTGARCIVLCVPGDSHLASGGTTRCSPRVLRVLRVPHVLGLLPPLFPLEMGCMSHAFSVFCNTTSKRSRTRTQTCPRQRSHGSS